MALLSVLLGVSYYYFGKAESTKQFKVRGRCEVNLSFIHKLVGKKAILLFDSFDMENLSLNCCNVSSTGFKLVSS